MKINKHKYNKVAVRILFVTFLTLFSSLSMQAQENTVSGVVTGAEDSMPIPGVSVIVTSNGKTRGTTTDFDGKFTIEASNGDELSFMYLGMDTKKVKVSGPTIKVQMIALVDELEEVVVVGYGTVKKKEITGAVAQVKAEEIEKFVTTDIASALQGQVAGVNVTAASGEPGSSASIQIRGVTSISGSNEPLWVVDGIAQNGDPGLSPNEIETIDILKDAASTAIYGAEGAAGVILVTTRQGKEGKMKVNLNASYGIQNLGTKLELMNTRETIFYEQTRLDNGASNYDVGPTNNYAGLNNDNSFEDTVLIDNAPTSQYSLNFSGGTKNFSYSTVLGYFKQDGTLINSGYERINGRTSSTYKTDKWRIVGSVAFTTDKRALVGNNLIVNALRFKPYYEKIDSSSDVVYSDGSGGNRTPLDVLAQSLKRQNNTSSDRINASLGITRQLIEGLSIGGTAGVAITNNQGHQFAPYYTVIDISGTNVPETDPTKSGVMMSTSRYVTVSADANLAYKKKIGAHNFGIQGVVAMKSVSRKSFTAMEQGVSNNNIYNLNTTTINPQALSGIRSAQGGLTGADYNTSLIGVVARVTYDYKGKYLFSSVIRRDGYSSFINKTWGVFPSISGAWNISSEDFWIPVKRTVNNFKLRLSRGTVGNNRFADPYAASSVIAGEADYIFDESDAVLSYGNAIRAYANANLQWETSISNNIGIDVGFLKNKLTMTADYYHTSREDMLFPVRLPGSSGVYSDRPYTDLVLNVGNMTNQGFEFATRYRFNIKQSKFDVSGTFTTNKNKITSMYGSDLIYNSNSTLVSGTQNVNTVLAKGYEVGAFWLFDTNGVVKTEEQLVEYRKIKPDARLGDLMYVDHDGVNGITNADRVYKGSALPDFEIGFNLKWTYRNFDLSTNWYASVGSELLNGNRAAAYQYGRHKEMISQWSVDNPTSNVPLHVGENKDTTSFQPDTDYWLEDGSYLRLRLATLGYTFKQDVCEKLDISGLRIYFNAQNPLTFSNYSGYDPEVGGSVTRRGIDSSRYPVTSLYTIGLNLKF